MDQGKGYVKIPANAQGDFTYNGVIKFKTSSGEILPFPFQTKYQVAKPSTTISATKMNVFYLGVDNPVDISAPGVAKDKIRASISNGSITKTSEGWSVRASKVGTAKVNVSAEVDGASKNMGGMEFRVKQIPTPVAKIVGKGSGSIRKVQLKAASSIRAELENFDFDVKVKVASYSMGYVQKNGLLDEVNVNGDKLNPEIKRKIDGLGRNSKVFFENIKVKMPDGRTVTLSPLNLKVI